MADRSTGALLCWVACSPSQPRAGRPQCSAAWPIYSPGKSPRPAFFSEWCRPGRPLERSAPSRHISTPAARRHPIPCIPVNRAPPIPGTRPNCLALDGSRGFARPPRPHDQFDPFHRCLRASFSEGLGWLKVCVGQGHLDRPALPHTAARTIEQQAGSGRGAALAWALASA